MEQRTVSEIVQHLEPVLRKFEKDENLTILDANEEPGSKIGDNYMSIVTRINITGKRGNGKQYIKSFITKHFPRHRQTTKFTRNADLFYNEVYAYEKLLPLLDPIGPECVYADQEQIIMEDLKSQGYIVCKRQNLLDFEHCVAVIQTLASLHAKSLALKLKNPVRFHELMDPLKEAVFPQDSFPTIGMSIDMTLKVAIKHLESIQPQTEELKLAINFLKGYTDKAYDTMKDLTVSRNEKYHVLSHGDAWNNNLMFKKDSNGKVVDVKLVDFQIVRHASLALDFHYFIYSSSKSSIVEQNYGDLVEIYHRSFIKFLRKLQVPEENIKELSPDWFTVELKKYSIYGLLTGFWLVGAILADENEAIDMDNITTEHLEKMNNTEITIRPKITERVKCIVLHYLRTYC